VFYPGRALIFDVDGTLVDSNDAHAAAWAEALRDFDIDREVDSIVPLIGMGGDKLLPRVAGVSSDSDLGRQIMSRRRELFRTVYFDHLRPFPATRELFERLCADGVRLGIASSARRDELEPLLELARVRDLVDPRGLASADDVGASKPDPDAIDAALNRLGTDPDATLMVGDSPYDVEAARRAGVGTIAFRCGGWGDRDLEEAIAIYGDPKELLADYDVRAWDWPAAPSRKGMDPGQAQLGEANAGGALPANHSLR
jgi:HAD superfamily hydrolase (TIGR01549 family)